MIAEFDARLRSFAEVIVRVGLNLQPGQRLLLTEPYELQGVARSAEVIVEAVRAAALEAGCPRPEAIEVIWGDGPRLREFAVKRDWRGLAKLVEANAATMDDYVRQGDALLFLQGSQPRLMEGVAAGSIAELQRIAWESFGPLAQQLMQGATNWTVAPAPSPGWAQAAYADRPAGGQLAALWETVFAALRVTEASPLEAWRTHLATLGLRRDELNARGLKSLRYQGSGTDLTVTLPDGHIWCTAQLKTRTGHAFVANLPTEEIFTVPHRDSAAGLVRVARPVSYGGSVIDGIELEFKRGAVVRAQARLGQDLLQRLLETDEGARRLGEVAQIGAQPEWATVSGPTPAADRDIVSRLFYHPLLDENASNHIALGEGYGFCLSSPNDSALNRSLIHVDLSIDARTSLSGGEPA